MLNKQFCADGITLNHSGITLESLFYTLFLHFVCKYLLFTFYSIVSEIVYMRNYFIHELELENDRGAVETSFVFFIACFYNKMFY